jgi:salicylate 5-hydroxylase small subunit
MSDKNYLLEVAALNAQYAHAIDQQDWPAWIDLFLEDCAYKIQPRENFERGFPLCTLSLLSKGMLKDRAYGIKETLFHDPYYQRHVISIPMIERVENDVIYAQTNYSVLRTKLSQETTVFNAGRYIDEISITEEGLKFRSRICVYDTEMIPNSLIYPI